MKRIISMLMVVVLTCAVNAQAVVPTDPNETCQEAWQKYKKGDVLWKTGWGLFVPGLVGTAVCGGCSAMTSFIGRPPSERTPADYVPVRTCLSLCAISGGAFLASIPCLAVGQSQRKSAMKMLEKQNCTQEPAVAFSLQSSEKGLGIAMHF